MRILFLNLRAWVKRNERYLSSGALLLGFVIDSITLNRIDQLFDLLVLSTYLFIAVIGITIFQLLAAGKITNRYLHALAPFIPLGVQFAFGGLFSGFLVFYSRSASLAGTWVFALILVGLLIGNEWFKKYYKSFRFQAGVYFFTLLSFLVFYLPIIIGSIGPWVFLLSVAAALLIMGLYLSGMYKLIPEKVRKVRIQLATIITLIAAGFVSLYFLNLIPPLPLSLKDAGVYHSVARTAPDTYEVVFEEKRWIDFFRAYNPVFHKAAGEPVYVFSAVFAPTDLETTLQHRWQYYDEVKGQWVTASTIEFPIRGGRGEGYRGYTQKSNVEPGKWRVDVMTEYGQIIGRISFRVETVPEAVPLLTETK